MKGKKFAFIVLLALGIAACVPVPVGVDHEEGIVEKVVVDVGAISSNSSNFAIVPGWKLIRYYRKESLFIKTDAYGGVKQHLTPDSDAIECLAREFAGNKTAQSRFVGVFDLSNEDKDVAVPKAPNQIQIIPSGPTTLAVSERIFEIDSIKTFSKKKNVEYLLIAQVVQFDEHDKHWVDALYMWENVKMTIDIVNVKSIDRTGSIAVSVRAEFVDRMVLLPGITPYILKLSDLEKTACEEMAKQLIKVFGGGEGK